MRLSFSDTSATLADPAIRLGAVAQFLDDVFNLGIYADPKAYAHAAKRHVKALDAKIIESATRIADFSMSEEHDTARLLRLAAIRSDVLGHFWRAERIKNGGF
jgi:hypothetical protein